MIIPERTETSEKRDDDGMDRELVQQEIEAMAWGAYGEAPANRPETVKPGTLVTRFDSFHEDE